MTFTGGAFGTSWYVLSPKPLLANNPASRSGLSGSLVAVRPHSGPYGFKRVPEAHSRVLGQTRVGQQPLLGLIVTDRTLRHAARAISEQPSGRCMFSNPFLDSGLMDQNAWLEVRKQVERAQELRRLAAEHWFDIQILVADFEQRAQETLERLKTITPR